MMHVLMQLRRGRAEGGDGEEEGELRARAGRVGAEE